MLLSSWSAIASLAALLFCQWQTERAHRLQDAKRDHFWNVMKGAFSIGFLMAIGGSIFWHIERWV